MRSRRRRADIALLFVLWAASGAGAGAGGEGASATLRLMQEKVIPASNTVFGATAEVPADDAGWREVEQALETLVASVREMADAPGGFAPLPWKDDAAAFARAVLDARRAVAARNVDALESANGALYQSCETCHVVYLPASK
ncbi:MAG: hypothetical protein LBT71_06000 [Azoarcus sp.]|jgi:cytochrome c556|nr:hypothetical protein [Azoarcus sp.]